MKKNAEILSQRENRLKPEKEREKHEVGGRVMTGPTLRVEIEKNLAVKVPSCWSTVFLVKTGWVDGKELGCKEG
jgi:hypothetical protein